MFYLISTNIDLHIITEASKGLTVRAKETGLNQ